MADYNVNMKQWNGTSFDNVLPLAYNSNKLDGKTYTEIYNTIKQYVDARKFVVGVYTGNAIVRTTIQTINVGFKPDVVFVMTNERGIVTSSGYHFLFSVAGDLILRGHSFNDFDLLKIVDSGFSVGGIPDDDSNYDSSASLNTGGVVYHYFAIKIS